MKLSLYSVIACILVAGSVTTRAADPAPDVFMGDWQESSTNGVVAQIIALGDGQYEAVVLPRFDTRERLLGRLHGTTRDDIVVFENEKGIGLINNGVLVIKLSGRPGAHVLKKVERRSPTLGKKAPKGAIVLFGGTDTGGWRQRNGNPCGWKIVDGAMEVTPGAGGDIVSTNVFNDHTLHIEFRTPFMPKARGQGRGNSGVYLQTRYEVQVLDSYGLEGKNNESGGIYGVSDPKVNACYPPLEWQTYDIQFRAPRYAADGTKTEDACMTVYHNGVLVQDKASVPGVTTSGVGGDLTTPQGLLLQDHGNPVQYRNIWAVIPD